MSTLVDRGRAVLRSVGLSRQNHGITHTTSATPKDPDAATEFTLKQIEFDHAVQSLLQGTMLRKVTRNKKVHTRLFQLDPDYQTLNYHIFSTDIQYYACHRRPHTIDLAKVKEVRPGWKTDVFSACKTSRRLSRKLPGSRCFSLILSNGETINLVAPSEELQKCWTNVIQHLIAKRQNQDRETRMEMWLERQFKLADTSKDGYLNFDECTLLLDRLNLHFSRGKAMQSFKKAGAQEQSSFSRKSKPSTELVLDAEGFRRFYAALAERSDLQEIFAKYATPGQPTWSVDNLRTFLRDVQHEDTQTVETGGFIIETFEPIEENRTQKQLSPAGFRNYLLSPRQFLFNHKNKEVYHDMTHPLKDYFIASSHNTYLMSNQLTGVSSVEAYVSCLLTGCRCVEIDCWDGPGCEPIVTHGLTLTTDILFHDVIVAVRDYGFITSKYPVILSIENHCSVEQQHVLAKHLTSVLGEKIYVEPVHRQGSLPSPHALMGRVIIKGKKHHERTTPVEANIRGLSVEDDALAKTGVDGDTLETFSESSSDEDDELSEDVIDSDQVKTIETNGKRGVRFEDVAVAKAVGKKLKLSAALSNGVYLSAVKFKSFAISKKSGRFFEMSSLAETKCTDLIKRDRNGLIDHCRYQLVRVYPDGLRTDSSNYNPLPMLHAGCQIVALNYQDRKPETQIYKALFKDNGGCGYLLKPEHMRNDVVNLDTTRKPLILKITVVSAQQLPKAAGIDDDDISDPYVTIQIYGTPKDCNKQATTYVRNNGFNPMWKQALQFVIYEPEMAVVRFEVKDYDKRSPDEVLAHYSIPVSCLRFGYRHVELYDKREVLLEPSTLFIHVEMHD